MERLTVEDGWLVAHNGSRYRALVLPPSDRMTPALLERIVSLIDAGATGAEVDEIRAGLVIDDDDQDSARDCLGATYDEMLADDLPHPVIELAVSTAFLAWTAGKATAEAWWESGGKAPTPPTARRPAGAHPTATPTPQAAATMTKTRVSRNGTKRRKRAKG